MRRTKIVATLGPASNSLEVIRRMVSAGVDVVRLNFSHGTTEEKKDLIAITRQAAKEEGKIVGIIADLQGPKIRVSKFKAGHIVLKDGATFTLDADLDKNSGDENAVGVDYRGLPDEVRPKDILLLDDGRLVLTVDRIDGKRVICTVKVGGELSNNKGINRQGGGLLANAITEKDREDLQAALSFGVDYIAISFVRSKFDIEEAKALIAKDGGKSGVLAKIERAEAIVPEVLEEIIKASDGVMVARGDLAVEIGDAEVPAAQKLIIDYARFSNKPVITATQMMETMIENVVPTRAEVSDVANAVLDGTDAVMLSAETATGKHPVLVIQTMDRICVAAEKQPSALGKGGHSYEDHVCVKVDEVISMSCMYIANHLKIKAVVSLTETGMTPLCISRVRSGIPIYGISRNKNALGKMALYSDVYPVSFDIAKFYNNTALKKAVLEELQQLNFIQEDDLVVVTNGDHIGISGGTNSLTILKAE